jgi:hypothetical protein
MTDHEPRLIAAHGEPGRAQAHLDPIAAAEVSWGNRVRLDWRRTDKLLDDRTLSLAEPFHVELLQRAFRLPDTVQMWAVPARPGRPEQGRLLISDTTAYVTIDSPLPAGWSFEGRIEW